MKQIYFFLTLLTFYSCKNEGNFSNAPSNWMEFGKSNTSGIGSAKIRFKHPQNWIENDEAQSEMLTRFLIAYPHTDLSKPNIYINVSFPVNMNQSFDQFVETMVIPTLHGENKQSVKVNNYNGYSFEIPSQNDEVSKSYILDNGKNPVFLTINASNKEIYDKNIATADSIVNTIIIE